MKSLNFSGTYYEFGGFAWSSREVHVGSREVRGELADKFARTSREVLGEFTDLSREF